MGPPPGCGTAVAKQSAGCGSGGGCGSKRCLGCSQDTLTEMVERIGATAVRRAAKIPLDIPDPPPETPEDEGAAERLQQWRAEESLAASIQIPGMKYGYLRGRGRRIQQGPPHKPLVHTDNLRKSIFLPTMDQQELLSERRWVVKQLLDIDREAKGTARPAQQCSVQAAVPASARQTSGVDAPAVERSTLVGQILGQGALATPANGQGGSALPQAPSRPASALTGRQSVPQRQVVRPDSNAGHPGTATAHRTRPASALSGDQSRRTPPGFVKKHRKDALWRLTQRPPTGSSPGNQQFGGPQWDAQDLAPMERLRPPPRPASAITVTVASCQRKNMKMKAYDSGISGRLPNGEHNKLSIKRLYGF